MSEENDKTQDICSPDESDESEKGDTPKEMDVTNSVLCKPLDENTKLVTITFEIPLECEQRVSTLNLQNSEDELTAYLLVQVQEFFAAKKAELSSTSPKETTSKTPEKGLNIFFEDQVPRKKLTDYPYPKRSPRTTARRLESSGRNEHEDSLNACEKNAAPVFVPSEPLPSFGSTFARPLRNLYGIPPQSEIPQTSAAAAESFISPETRNVSSMEFSETVRHVSDIANQIVSHHPTASGNTYADNISTLYKFLLQDLLELKEFINGVQLNPEGPSTSGDNLTSEELAAVSIHFGTGVESNAAIATRHYLEDAESGITCSIQALGLGDYRVVNPAQQAVSHQAGRTVSSISPVSLKGKANGSPKKSVPGTSKSSSPSKQSYQLKSWIEDLNVTQISVELRNLNLYSRIHYNGCVVNIEEILNYCRESVPEDILGDLEKFVAVSVEILEELVKLRRECSFLLKKCRNRYSNEGITYILKVKMQIALRYNELIRRLLNSILTFRATHPRDKHRTK